MRRHSPHRQKRPECLRILAFNKSGFDLGEHIGGKNMENLNFDKEITALSRHRSVQRFHFRGGSRSCQIVRKIHVSAASPIAAPQAGLNNGLSFRSSWLLALLRPPTPPHSKDQRWRALWRGGFRCKLFRGPIPVCWSTRTCWESFGDEPLNQGADSIVHLAVPNLDIEYVTCNWHDRRSCGLRRV